MNCPNCEQIIGEGAHFCPGCGTPLGTSFCHECGTSKGGSKPRGSALDRVVAWILIISVLGYVSYSYFRSHEEERTLLQSTVRDQTSVLLDQASRVGDSFTSGAVELLTGADENGKNISQEEDLSRYTILRTEDVEVGGKTLYDLDVQVSTRLTSTDLISVANQILRDKIKKNPNDIYILTFFSGLPSVAPSEYETDPRFLAKFLHLGEDDVRPPSFAEVSGGLLVKWKK